MTYLELTASIKGWAEDYDDEFVGKIDKLIRQVENRISTSVRVPAENRNTTFTIAGGTSTVTLPSDLLAIDSVTPVGHRPLLKKDPEFIFEAYPTGFTARPRFFAMPDDHTMLVGPVPDQDYQATLYYLSQAQSIVDSPNGTYISLTYPAALLSGCLWMTSLYMKDWEGAAIHHQNFQEALGLGSKLISGPMQKQRAEKTSSAVD